MIPRVFWTQSSRRVLTMDLVRGTRMGDREALDRAGHDRRQLAVSGCAAYMRMIFEHGFFQADPHPGNLIVQADGRIAILDYGMFGRIREMDRHRIVDLLLAAFDQRPELIVRLLVEAGFTGADTNQERLTDDIQDLLDRYYGLELRRTTFGQVVGDLLGIMRNHQLRIPAGFSQLMRGLATVEGLGLTIDPQFDFVKEMRPFVAHSARQRLNPATWLKAIKSYAADFEMLFHNLPADLRQVLEHLKKGQIELVLNPDEFRKIGRSLEQSNNRLSAAIVLAAIIIGSSLMVFAAPKGMMAFVPWVGIAGFVAALAIGFWLLFNAIRGGKF